MEVAGCETSLAAATTLRAVASASGFGSLATGLTPAHVNRPLQEFRRDCLIELKSRRVMILNLPRRRVTA